MLQDIEIAEETDDLELAWENLDLARLILSKMEDKESQLKLGDVHIVLGDVSLESENFELAVQVFIFY
jgi:urease accessory protein UreE